MASAAEMTVMLALDSLNTKIIVNTEVRMKNSRRTFWYSSTKCYIKVYDEKKEKKAESNYLIYIYITIPALFEEDSRAKEKRVVSCFTIIGFVIERFLQFLLKAKLLRDFNSFAIVSQIRAALYLNVNFP